MSSNKNTRKARGNNPPIFRPGINIGNIDADADDEFLFDCFVDHPALANVLDVQSSGMILSGRTGAGKTAVLRYIEKTAENAARVDPTEMSLSYITNSDILNFLIAIGADLDLFFQVLWKHVLCIEFIRLRYKNREDGFINKICDMFKGDKSKERALKYLSEWQGDFWITVDQNIKEITQRYEARLKAEIGGDLAGIALSAGADGSLSNEKRLEIISRAKRVINAEQLSDLNSVISLLSEQKNIGRTGKYFILIDKLDDRWVDDTIRFRLIRALIESLKAFRKIQNLKIVVALRSDVLERVVQETQDLGFQREKYDSLFVPLRWNKTSLKELVQKRINFLFRKKYTRENVHFEDIFPQNVGNKDPWDYIVEKTLLRPRDILSFVNEALERAEGQNLVTPRYIREAEGEFSRIRLQALEEEWRSSFPSLPRLIKSLSSKNGSISVSDLSTSDMIEDLALPICAEDQIAFDPFHKLATNIFGKNPPAGIAEFARQMVCTLYRVGVIGVKLQPNERFLYSHIDQPFIPSSALSPDVKVRVHPMLHRSLNIAS